jgi:endonuclease IV
MSRFSISTWLGFLQALVGGTSQAGAILVSLHAGCYAESDTTERYEDAMQLYQMIHDLIHNAIEAMSNMTDANRLALVGNVAGSYDRSFQLPGSSECAVL